MITITPRTVPLVTMLVTALATWPSGHLAAQSLEGSKWSIDQEGIDTPVLWWLGSQGRVRTGDVGSILPGYKWIQKADSIIVTVGDTVRYAGLLMSNRLVGVRIGPRRQEGWWSGARTDGPTAVAAAPTTPAGPTLLPSDPNTEQLSRPADQGTAPAATPTTPTTTRPAGPRQLRRIERTDGSTPTTPPAAQPSGGNGNEIRRLPRPSGRAATPAATEPAASFEIGQVLGRWRSRNPALGIALELNADNSATFTRQDRPSRSARWAMSGEGLLLTVDVTGEGDREVVVRPEGRGLRMQPRGSLLYILLDRATAGAEREPAVRQP